MIRRMDLFHMVMGLVLLVLLLVSIVVIDNQGERIADQAAALELETKARAAAVDRRSFDMAAFVQQLCGEVAATEQRIDQILRALTPLAEASRYVQEHPGAWERLLRDTRRGKTTCDVSP